MNKRFKKSLMTNFERSLIELAILTTHTPIELYHTATAAFYYKRFCNSELLLLELIKRYSKKKELVFAMLSDSEDLAKINRLTVHQVEWRRRLRYWATSHTIKTARRSRRPPRVYL